MKLRIDRDALADAVTAPAKGLPNRPSVPVLSGLLLAAKVGDTPDTGTLTVRGFDYEVSNEATAPAVVDEPGDVLVSGRLLSAIVAALPNKPVDVTAVGANVELVCGSARFTLPTMPVEDYPTLPAMPEQVGAVDATTFAAAVGQVVVAAGRDDTLPMMTGVRMEIDGPVVRMMATDRYRLAVRELPWNPADPGMDAKVLIPASVLADTAKGYAGAGGDVTLALAGGDGTGMVGFSVDGRATTSRLLDGQNYPPVWSLFPKDTDVKAHAVVSVVDLVAVVKRISLVAERTTPVLLSFGPDGLVVEAGSTEEARASEAMAATFTGDPLTIGFNPGYLLDGLQNLGTPTALLAFVDAYKPAVIHPATDDGEAIPGYRYLIMPIRVTR